MKTTALLMVLSPKAQKISKGAEKSGTQGRAGQKLYFFRLFFKCSRMVVGGMGSIIRVYENWEDPCRSG